MSEDIWAGVDVISVYTRAQMIADGGLVELDPASFDGAGIFKFPVGFTSALWAECERGNGSNPATLKGRVWDVCYMSTAATARKSGPDSFYEVIVGSQTLTLRANIGPGDEGEPVMTIGFPEDF